MFRLLNSTQLVSRVILIMGALGLNLSVMGETRPFWTEKSSFVEGAKLYVVGVATHAKSLEEGRIASINHAKKELEELVGSKVKSGVPLTTQMTYEEQEKDGRITVFRLLYISAADFYKMENRGFKRGSHLKCFGTLSGAWTNENAAYGDNLMFGEDCKFLYEGPGCTSSGTLSAAIAESGVLSVNVTNVVGNSGACMAVGTHTCNYITTDNTLAYDCGRGQLKYKRKTRDLASER